MCVLPMQVIVPVTVVAVELKMAQVEWCEECGRMVGIGCSCGQSFREKIKSVSFSTEGLPTLAPIQASDSYKERFPTSKLSKDKPPPL